MAYMKWNPAKRQLWFLLCSYGRLLLVRGFVSGRLPVIRRESREASLCLEARTGKVFAVIDCRVVVKFDMPRSYWIPCGAPYTAYLSFHHLVSLQQDFQALESTTCLLWFGADWSTEQNMLVGSSFAIEWHKWLKCFL